MRKISFIALFAAVIGMTMMSSCSKDETHATPTITLDPSATSTELDFTAGDSVVAFSARVQAEGEIETFTINEVVTNLQGGTTSSAYDGATTGTFSGETDKTYDFNKTFTPADFTSATQYAYTFSVTDKDDQSYSITYTVTQNTGTQAGAIDTYTAVLMGAQSSTTGSYYDVSTNTVYNQSGADANQAAIDFVHYYGSANASTICAPSDATVGGGSGNLTMCQSWSTRNATKFGKTSGVTWSGVTDDTQIVAHESDATSTIVNQLAVGDIVEFKNADGKYGMFKVGSVDTDASGSITIGVKVQQ